MSRLFTQDTSAFMTLGTNVMGAAMNGLVNFLIRARVKYYGFTMTNNTNRIVSFNIASNQTGFTLCTDNARHLRLGGRSGITDAFLSVTGTSELPLNRWIDVGAEMLLNTGAGTGTINIYRDAILEASTAGLALQASVFTNGVHTTDVDLIGGSQQNGPPTSAQLWGELEGVVMYASAGPSIGQQGFKALMDGVNPLELGVPILYLPLEGKRNPELCYATNIQGAITGWVPRGAPSSRQIAQAA